MNKIVAPGVYDYRVFGLIWSVLLILIGYYFVSKEYKIFFYGLSFLLVIVTVIKPVYLALIYMVWMKFGRYMGVIISSLILVVMFYIIFTPIALFLKVLKKDLLDKKIDKHAKSYWKKRKVQPEPMKFQF